MFLLFLIPLCQGLISNFDEIFAQPVAGMAKTPADLSYTGDYVCDKFASVIQSTNNTDEFPVDFNLYVSNTPDAPTDNYTVDLYFRNEYHQSYNEFALFNVSESKDVLSQYNPILISKQPQFGIEFKFDFHKGLLCQFLYQFTVAYQLQHVNNTNVKSDKIFVVGSCQENKQYHYDSYSALVDQGYRCVEYNSGFKYEGGKDWCSKFYPPDQCCKSFTHDELTSRDECPAGSDNNNNNIDTLNLKSGNSSSSSSSSSTQSSSGVQLAPTCLLAMMVAIFSYIV